MFGLSKRERAAYELVIESQREEIHWLRSCIPWAVPTGGTVAPSPRLELSKAPLPLVPLGSEPDRLYMTEEEEDLDFYVRNGDLDLTEAQELLAAAGARNPEEIEMA